MLLPRNRKPASLLNLPMVLKDQIAVVKRFTGGGTVVVDESTLFVSLICSSTAIPNVPCFPRPIMEWTEEVYSPVFEGAPGFRLREHDYVFGDKKFGGNAQSITKQRWVHHTSFLWDFKDERMQYLLQPGRAPEYRKLDREDYRYHLSKPWPIPLPRGCAPSPWSGTSTTPYSKEQEERAAAILRERTERMEKRELIKQAKMLALLEEQEAKTRQMEEELKKWTKEQEEKMTAIQAEVEKEEEEEKQVEEEVPLERRRGGVSTSKEEEIEKTT
ncbi:hypothetical protein CBR_g58409 [Chara braunii]|uniref:BPL/LPL catalytic domain-containing protein n=1 Tax=Chara braunii TaxID=69332 RepID=A0A388MES4_CHABU|nr:hypothetical protein CBR_g58409 [Chara braunii]|eukprot:GBG93054.1 hypothetical protein CBR_g58409 [Chara braunii]